MWNLRGKSTSINIDTDSTGWFQQNMMRDMSQSPLLPADAPPPMTDQNVDDLDWTQEARPREVAYRLARWVLAAFVITFACSRILVLLIMSRKIPDLYLHMGGNHVHHLNYGIFLLTFVGAYLVFFQPQNRRLHAAAAVYGVGLGLTFDEFGMWYHLGGLYWQRASFDAVVVIASLLGLIAVAPEFKKFGPGHWRTTAIIGALVAVFGVLLLDSVIKFGNRAAPRLERIEESAPT